jgi:hypothetical protein
VDDPETSPKKQLVPRRGGDRNVSQRPVAFRCAWCGEPVVELRYPGPTPAYGHACAAEARRHADAAKAARRRGSPEPARIVTTSCKGSPTNLHGRDIGAEPDRVELIVRAPSEGAARAALALLQARLGLDAPATPTPSAAGGWEIAITLPPPTEQPTESAPPPAPSLIDQSEATFPDDSELNQDNAAPFLSQEIASEVRTVASSRHVIRGFLQDFAATKSIGVRWGQALIRELENLSWRIAHLRIQQAMTTEGITVSADVAPIVQAAAYARAHTEFQLHALRDRLDAQGNLRGSARAELIALAEELSETARVAAATMDGVEVTDGTIALATWEALDSLPLVPTAHLAPPPPPPRPPRQPQAKQPQTKQPQAKQPQAKSQRRLTLEEAARQLGLSTGRVAELARSGELGRKEGGRWTFSEAEVRRVARERADHEKAVKLRKKLENDRRRLNGLPPKRRKKRRKARELDDDDPPRRRRERGLNIDDMGPLFMLDQILAQERALEQRYNLPFRAPLQTAARLHRCKRCDAPLVFLIFGERAVDVAGLDAYGRLMEPHIKEHGVPTYVLGKANGEGDDAISLFRRVWPDHGEVMEMTGNRWEAFLDEQSRAHQCGGKSEV